MHYIGPLALILGGLICLSSFIISKKPEAKQLFEKVAPYQGFLGVALLLWGLYDLYHYLFTDIVPGVSWFKALKAYSGILAIGVIGMIIGEILIGFILGFGLIASWIPGEGAAEKKGLEIQKKLLTLALPIGIIGIVASVLVLLKHPGGG